MQVASNPYYRSTTCNTKGFTLLELSIAMAIIAVIVGGVLVGQDMMRNTRVKNLVNEQASIHTAVQVFYEKFNALPGDMPDATRIWGVQHSTASTCITTGSTSKLTCNGNGNGKVAPLGVGAEAYEEFRFWQHLVNSGLIEGVFDGVDDSYVTVLKPVVFRFSQLGTFSGTAPLFNGTYNHTLFFPLSADNIFLTPSEMVQIDKKLDDGKPALGDVVSTTLGTTGSLMEAQCALKANLSGAPAVTDLDAVYNLSQSERPTCLFLRRNFTGR